MKPNVETAQKILACAKSLDEWHDKLNENEIISVACPPALEDLVDFAYDLLDVPKEEETENGFSREWMHEQFHAIANNKQQIIWHIWNVVGITQHKGLPEPSDHNG